jgi:hypothetical protein
VLTVVGKVQYQARKDPLLHLSRVRYAISAVIIWYRVALHPAVAVKAAGMYPLEVEVGGLAQTVMALASNGDDAR